jgi:DNA-binding response OmpR family regulator
MEAAHAGEVLRIGELEIRPGEGLVVVAGRTLTVSVREFELLVELARNAHRMVRREHLYHAVWGGELRDGDRSIDVYVHKLRVKLESALPTWRFIHTHVGFGYRLEPESTLSQAFHTRATSR